MTLSSVAVTGDIADQLGTDFDARRTKIWVSTNIESGTVIDTAGNAIRLGTGNVTLNDDGTFTASVWTPGTGSNPDSWQTYIHVDYPDRNTAKGRATRTFGPFTITAAADLADLVEEQEVPAEYLTTVTTLLDGYVTDAETARDETQAIRDGIVGDLGTTDSQTATLINSPGSLTETALSASYVSITKRPINLSDYADAATGPSLDFTGATDSAIDLQAIFDAAGGGTRFELGRPGVLRCDDTVTTPEESILDGNDFRLGKYVGHTSELVFAGHTGTEVALQMGPDSTVENLLVRGPGNAGGGIGIRNDNTGLSGPSHSARLRNVSVTGFSVGIDLEDCYYALLDGIESAINDKAVRLTDCNNISMIDPRLFCQSNWDGGTGRTGIEIVGALAGLTVLGGSIEEYGASGGLRLSSVMNATVLGTYFESNKSGAIGVTTPGSAVTNAVLALRDCYVLLDNHNRWVNFDAVNSVLTASGNRFTSTNSAATPFGYIVNPTNSTSTNNTVDLRGDSWEEIAGASSSSGGFYCDTFALTTRGYSIAPPRAYRVGGFGDYDYRGRKAIAPASTTAGASLNIPHGTAPSSPANGDMWTTTAGLYVRINGATIGPLS